MHKLSKSGKEGDWFPMDDTGFYAGFTRGSDAKRCRRTYQGIACNTGAGLGP